MLMSNTYLLESGDKCRRNRCSWIEILGKPVELTGHRPKVVPEILGTPQTLPIESYDKEDLKT